MPGTRDGEGDAGATPPTSLPRAARRGVGLPELSWALCPPFCEGWGYLAWAAHPVRSTTSLNVLGWCGGEEKCRMSLPDREKTRRLFISGHLPQTAFSPFAFDMLQLA